jgi:hypothetical protein
LESKARQTLPEAINVQRVPNYLSDLWRPVSHPKLREQGLRATVLILDVDIDHY